MPGLNRSRERAISVDHLHECFILDPLTGSLTWRDRPLHHFPSKRGFSNFARQFAGKPAGAASRDGYIRVWVLGYQHLAHRIVYAMAWGVWPNEELDHIDRSRGNNSPGNLRLAGPLINSWNHGVPRNNTSGFKGVKWIPHANAWRAKIVSRGITRELGYFKDAREAGLAYAAAAAEMRGSYAEPAS